MLAPLISRGITHMRQSETLLQDALSSFSNRGVLNSYSQNLAAGSGSLCRMAVMKTELKVPGRHSFIVLISQSRQDSLI